MIGGNIFTFNVYENTPTRLLFIAINQSIGREVTKEGKIRKNIYKGSFNKKAHFLNTGGQELVDFLLDIATLKEKEIIFDFSQKQKFSN